MDSSRSPPSPTFFPTVRSQGTSRTSYLARPFSPSQPAPSTRSPPASRPLSSSAHLLQDLEPRTYDSPSDAESAFSGYKDSPTTPTQQKGPRNKTQTQSQSRRGTGKWPARRFDGRTTHNDSIEEGHGLELKRTPRWSQIQTQTYDDSPQEQHPLDPTPQSMSLRGSRPDHELPRWARSTDAGRRGEASDLAGKEEVPENMRPQWMRSPAMTEAEGGKVKFSIPPPITESLMLPIKATGERRVKSDESLLSSIFGAFSGTSRLGRGSGDTTVVGRNKVSKLGEEWTDIVRQERVIHDRIQELLDRQTAGLQAKDGGRGTEKGSSTRSEASRRSSTTSSGRDGRHASVSKRALQTARTELLSAMYTLTDLATAKEAVLLQTSQSLEAAHKQLQTWQAKLNTTERKIKEFDNEANNDDTVWKELQELEPLIVDLERKLKIAKERKKRLLRQQKEQDSEREAGASKWVETKRNIEGDVGRWLREPPVPADMLEQDNYWSEFMSLTPQRRNLEVAVENLAGAIRGIRKRLAGAQTERDACERGAVLWAESLEVVLKAEKGVKGWIDPSLHSKGDPVDEIIALMEDTEETLLGRMGIAEKEGWNLVICALGAEIEAWKKGLEIVMGMNKGKGKNREQTPQHDHQKGDEQSAGGSLEHEDRGDGRKRGASVNTNSTEDPMWGSGVDKDAKLVGDLEAALEDNDARPLVDQESTGISNEMRNSRDSGVSGGERSRLRNAPEDCYTIITEGLRVSPAPSPKPSAAPSPWRGSVKGRGSARGSVAASPVKAGSRVGEPSQPVTPSRELSFRTAREFSALQESNHGDGELGEWAERLEREREESPEALTPREQGVSPHRGNSEGKGIKRETMDGGRDEESDDGKLPGDLLG